jgi:hypothetical protein
MPRHRTKNKPVIEDPDTLINLANPLADNYLKQASYSCELYKRKLDYVLQIENEAKTQNFKTVKAYLPKKYRETYGAVAAYLIAKGYTDKFLKNYSQDPGRRPEDQPYLDQISQSLSVSSGSSKSSRSSRSGSSRSRKSSSSRSHSRSMSGSGLSGGSRRRLRLKSRRT